MYKVAFRRAHPDYFDPSGLMIFAVLRAPARRYQLFDIVERFSSGILSVSLLLMYIFPVWIQRLRLCNITELKVCSMYLMI